jgi:hypothetical protein
MPLRIMTIREMDMKTAGITLGIVGSFFALYCALISFNAEAILEYPGLMTELGGGEGIINAVIALKWVLASALFISVFLGTVGSVMLCKRGTLSGILLVTAAVLSAVTVCGVLAAVCYTIGGIFAFVSDKRSLLKHEDPQSDDSNDYDMGI